MIKQKPNPFIKIIRTNTTVFVLFFLVGCLQNDLKTISSISGPGSSGGNDGGSCKTLNTKFEPYLNVYEKQKIYVSDFQDVGVQSIQGLWSILKNTEIILKLDLECLEKMDGSISKSYKNSVRKYLRSDLKKEDYVLFRTQKSISFLEFEKNLNEDPCVLGAAPNSPLELQAETPQDPLFDSQNNLKMIHYDEVYSQIFSDIKKEVLVAVVDSGSDQMNPDMLGRHWKNEVEFSGQLGVDDDGNGYVDDIYGYSWACYIGGDKPYYAFWLPHGEHVSGIIAAHTNNQTGISGIASPIAKIMNLNVMYNYGYVSNCEGSEEDLVLAIRAIRYAADNGAQVVNLSMGTFGKNSMMEDVMRYAVSKGVFVAAAAGNKYKEITPTQFFYPCGYAKDIDGFMCVGAMNSLSPDEKCDFSNYSSEYVEITAPGCDTSVGDQVGYSYGSHGVLSTVRQSMTPMYQYMAGTSMASPHVAAAAAIVMGYIETKTGAKPSPALVEEILKNSSRKSVLLNNSVKDGNALDLRELYLYLKSQYDSGCL